MIIYSEWSQDGLATTELSLQEMKGAGRRLFIRQIVSIPGRGTKIPQNSQKQTN